MQSTQSCEDQERQVRLGLNKLGIDDGGAVVVHDRAQSGTDAHRDKFVELQNMVAAGQVAILAVDDQSRLTRAGNALEFVQDLVFAKGRFISTSENIDTEQKGWQIRVKVTELKNSMIIDGLPDLVRRGQTGRLLRNLTAGDYPYGYESFYVNPNDATRSGRGPKPEKNLRIKESEAFWVRFMVDKFLDNWSAARIAAELEKRKAPRNRRAKNRPWTDTSVRNILKNDKYGTGVWVRNQTTTVYSSSSNQKKKRSRKAAVPEGEWIRVERPDLVIIDAQRWSRVQQRFAELDKVYGKKPGQKRRGPKVHHSVAYPQSLLGGLLFCTCGARLHYKSSSSKAYYACPQAGSGLCDMRTGVKIADAERTLLDLIAEVCKRTPGWLQLTVAAVRRKAEELARAVPEKILGAEQRLVELGGQIGNLVQEIARGRGSNAVSDLLAELEREKEVLSSEIAEAKRLIEGTIVLPDDGWIASHFADLGTTLGCDVTKTASLMRRMIGRIAVEAVVAPGKQRGFARLRFRFDGASVLQTVLGERVANSLWQHVRFGADEATSDEVVLDLGVPTRGDRQAEQVAAWKAEGVTWSEICRRTGLSKATAFAAWKRTKASTGPSGSANDDDCDDAA
jgi:hypothetical protein